MSDGSVKFKWLVNTEPLGELRQSGRDANHHSNYGTSLLSGNHAAFYSDAAQPADLVKME